MIKYCVYCTYGIEVIKEGICITRTNALFENIDEAQSCAEKFNRLKLSPTHLNDVISDIKYSKLLDSDCLKRFICQG